MVKNIIIIIFLIIHMLLYLCCFIGIIKRKLYAVITLRSPKLLFTHNLAGLLTSVLFYLKLIMDHNQSDITNLGSFKEHYYYIPSLYYLFQIMMIASFSLSCQRIIYSSNIYEGTTKLSAKKKLLYNEKFYLKFIITLFVVLVCFIIILDITLRHPFTMNVLESIKNKTVSENDFYISQSNVWLIVNLIENLILLTYAFLIWMRDIHLKLKLETMIFFSLWFIYSLCISIYEIYLDNLFSQTTIAIFSLCYLFLCLLLNGFFPIILSYYSGDEVGYTFSSNLANDLYLFLSNENCYGAFYAFVMDNKNDSLYLKLYTQIMAIKLTEVNKKEEHIVIDLANDVLKTIRESNSDDEQYNSIQNEITNHLGERVDESNYKSDMFDVLLKFVFGKLSFVFNEFKKMKEFKTLINGIKANSMVQGNIVDKGLGGKY